jgi:antitoxin component YwqK of YwqJK toxin-antitoxin module
MKSAIYILLLLFFSRYAFAQKEYPDCKQTYFTTGELSSKKCFDTNKRFGKATAYNKTGSIIYEKELRTIGGHASVEFTFYPNGALNKASWSSAPDAGIQWYNSTDIFSEDGKLVSHTENNYDDYLHLTAPYNPKQKDTTLIKPDSVLSDKKKVITYFINHTYYSITVMTFDKSNGKLLNERNMKPGDIINVVMYEYTKNNFEPSRKYHFKIIPTSNKKEQRPFIKKVSQKTLTNKNKAFYYIIENK